MRTTRFYYGQIVAVSFHDGKRKTDLRPAVIIDEDLDYAASGEILIVPISKKRTLPCPYYHIQVHGSTKKDPCTGLYYPCWAKCNLGKTIPVSRIKSHWGVLPRELLERITSAFDRIFEDPTFTDWQ